MRVLVDLDGVVADWGFGYDREAEFYGLWREGGMAYSDRPTWDLNWNLTPKGKLINQRIMERCGFYRELPPIPGAISAIHTLARSFEIWFVSTPFLTHETCASEKLAWVGEHFGQEYQRRTILTMDKTLVNGDVLIDDKPEVTGVATPTWKHLCFGDYGYSSTTQSQRVRDWGEAQEAVLLMQWERELLATKVRD